MRAKEILEKNLSLSSVRPFDHISKTELHFIYIAMEEYAKEKAWEVWKYIADQYETHSLHYNIEKIAFEKWWEENK